MSNSESGTSRAARSAPARIIQTAMLQTEAARNEFVSAATRNSETDIELHRQFHEAVISYYFALRRHRERNTVSKKWETAKALRPALARPAHPRGVTDAEAREIRREGSRNTGVHLGGQVVDLDALRRTDTDDDGREWLRGLDHLAEYSNKKEEVWVRTKGPNDKALKKTVAPVLIGAKDLIRVSGTLDDIAEELSISALAEQTKHPRGRINPDA